MQGYSLNLAVKGTTQECKLLNDTKGTVGEICILVKFSPRRDNMLGDIKQNLEMEGGNIDEQSCSTLAKFSITRWTVRSGCYKKVIDSYDSLYELWASSVTEKLDHEIKGRIIGCQKFNLKRRLELKLTAFVVTNLCPNFQNLAPQGKFRVGGPVVWRGYNLINQVCYRPIFFCTSFENNFE